MRPNRPNEGRKRKGKYFFERISPILNVNIKQVEELFVITLLNGRKNVIGETKTVFNLLNKGLILP